MDFSLSKEQQDIKAAAREFAEKEFPQMAEECDENEKTTFIKFRVRDAINFAIVSVATALTLSKGMCRYVRIFLGAMAPVPLRATRAEAFLKGKKITPENAGQAASLAFEGSKSLSMNAYKIQIA